MEIEKCKMKGGDYRERERILKNGFWTLLFELVKQLMHYQTLGLEGTSLGSWCGQERPQPPIMQKHVQRKAKKILFTNWQSF